MASSKPVFSSEDAKVFLEKHGLSELISVIVDQHKFDTVATLKLLARNQEMVRAMEIPLRYYLQLKELLANIDKDKTTSNMSAPAAELSVPPPEPKEKTAEAKGGKELSKKDLLQLAKTDMQAQLANCKLNAFHSAISRMVNKVTKENKWQGNGALKVSAGTTFEEAKTNCHIVAEILEDVEIKSLLGVYEVDDHGVVTLTNKRAKSFIGQKLSQIRKPSAYKGGDAKKERGCKRRVNVEEQKQNKKVKNDSVNKQHETQKNAEDKQPENLEEDNEDSEDNEDNVEDSHSEYEKQCMDRVRENKLKLLSTGLVPKEFAIMVTLFYMKVRKLSEVRVDKLKEICKAKNYKPQKKATKDDICASLGKLLYGTDVQRINNDDVIKFNNLRFM